VACWRRRRVAAAAAPDVVLVTLDTVRPTAWVPGLERGLTPALDALARDAVVSSRRSRRPRSRPSPMHDPERHVSAHPRPCRTSGSSFRRPCPGCLRRSRRGVPGGRLRGLDRARNPRDRSHPLRPRLLLYDAAFERRRDGADPYKTKERRGRGRRASARVARGPPRRPGLPLGHLYDASRPYDARSIRLALRKGAYDAEIAGVDGAFGGSSRVSAR
jgi:hypothetical protein